MSPEKGLIARGSAKYLLGHAGVAQLVEHQLPKLGVAKVRTPSPA